MADNIVNVELPEPLVAFVAERVNRGEFASAGAYLQDLVQRDAHARAAARLRELIEEGLASGPAEPFTQADVAALRQRIAAVGR